MVATFLILVYLKNTTEIKRVQISNIKSWLKKVDNYASCLKKSLYLHIQSVKMRVVRFVIKICLVDT